MKFVVQNKALLNALQAVGKAIPNRPPIAILSSFMFELKQNRLYITASDSEFTIKSNIDVDEAEGSGAFCIEAKRITDLHKALPECPITYVVDDETKKVVIKYDSGHYNLVGNKGEDYPQIAMDETPKVAQIAAPASVITSAIDKVGFAVSSDDFRPVFKGIHWDVTEDAIVFVATDGQKMAKYRNTMVKPQVACKFGLPTKVGEIVRTLAAKETDICVTLYEKSVIIEGNAFEVRSSIINGRFPDYNRVIPTNYTKAARINRKSFLNAVTRVSVCDTSSNIIKLSINNEWVRVTAEDANFSAGGTERVKCEYNGDETQIGFQSENLKNTINTIPTNDVVVKLDNGSRAALFLPAENDKHGELIILVMPVNISPAK